MSKQKVSILRKVQRQVQKAKTAHVAYAHVHKCACTSNINANDKQIILDAIDVMDSLEEIQQYVKDAIYQYEE